MNFEQFKNILNNLSSTIEITESDFSGYNQIHFKRLAFNCSRLHERGVLTQPIFTLMQTLSEDDSERMDDIITQLNPHLTDGQPLQTLFNGILENTEGPSGIIQSVHEFIALLIKGNALNAKSVHHLATNIDASNLTQSCPEEIKSSLVEIIKETPYITDNTEIYCDIVETLINNSDKNITAVQPVKQLYAHNLLTPANLQLCLSQKTTVRAEGLIFLNRHELLPVTQSPNFCYSSYSTGHQNFLHQLEQRDALDADILGIIFGSSTNKHGKKNNLSLHDIEKVADLLEIIPCKTNIEYYDAATKLLIFASEKNYNGIIQLVMTSIANYSLLPAEASTFKASVSNQFADHSISKYVVLEKASLFIKIWDILNRNFINTPEIRKTLLSAIKLEQPATVTTSPYFVARLINALIGLFDALPEQKCNAKDLTLILSNLNSRFLPVIEKATGRLSPKFFEAIFTDEIYEKLINNSTYNTEELLSLISIKKNYPDFRVSYEVKMKLQDYQSHSQLNDILINMKNKGYSDAYISPAIDIAKVNLGQHSLSRMVFTNKSGPLSLEKWKDLQTIICHPTAYLSTKIRRAEKIIKDNSNSARQQSSAPIALGEQRQNPVCMETQITYIAMRNLALKMPEEERALYLQSFRVRIYGSHGEAGKKVCDFLTKLPIQKIDINKVALVNICQKMSPNSPSHQSKGVLNVQNIERDMSLVEFVNNIIAVIFKDSIGKSSNREELEACDSIIKDTISTFLNSSMSIAVQLNTMYKAIGHKLPFRRTKKQDLKNSVEQDIRAMATEQAIQSFKESMQGATLPEQKKLLNSVKDSCLESLNTHLERDTVKQNLLSHLKTKYGLFVSEDDIKETIDDFQDKNECIDLHETTSFTSWLQEQHKPCDEAAEDINRITSASPTPDTRNRAPSKTALSFWEQRDCRKRPNSPAENDGGPPSKREESTNEHPAKLAKRN